MPKNKSTDNFSNSSLLDMLTGVDGNFSSAEIEVAIDKLRKAKLAAERREELEKYRKEKREAERKAAEEKAKKEAYVREVTSMDLPLHLENAFTQDVRTQGVHANSVSDGLIYSLSNLGRVDIEYISSTIINHTISVIICQRIAPLIGHRQAMLGLRIFKI